MQSDLDKHIYAYGNSFKYSLDNELTLNWYPHRIIKKMKKGSILELGLGHGYTTKTFSKNTNRYLIIEGSIEVINKFKKNNSLSNIEIQHCYFEDFQSNEKFDNIIMGFILEHVDDPDFIIDRYKTFLKSDGKLFITVPNSESLNRRVGYEAKLLQDLEYLSDADLLLGHKRYYNLNKLTDMAAKHNLKIISKEGIFLKSITTDQIKKLNLSKEILNGYMKVGINYPELCHSILLELDFVS
ncbi:MAG: class I SAM-dependent methyltransferase [Candidatus Thorarchaeota archaeon]